MYVLNCIIFTTFLFPQRRSTREAIMNVLIMEENSTLVIFASALVFIFHFVDGNE